jgi:hypothetical protein
MNKETNKLFLVKLIGLCGGTVNTDYNESYVIAKDLTEAYNKYEKYLDENDIGFKDDRELQQITLLAEETRYPDCKTLLIM